MKSAICLCVAVIFVFVPCILASAAGIGWEAEDAAKITAPLEVREDVDASGGKYIATPTSNQGMAEYEFRVPRDGVYFLWAHQKTDNASHNSYFLSIDDPNLIDVPEYVWDIYDGLIFDNPDAEQNKGVHLNQWAWGIVIERPGGEDAATRQVYKFELKAGKHTMYLAGREPEAKVDAFYLSNTFDEEPVFPGEASGWAVDSQSKVISTWGAIKW